VKSEVSESMVEQSVMAMVGTLDHSRSLPENALELIESLPPDTPEMRMGTLAVTLAAALRIIDRNSADKKGNTEEEPVGVTITNYDSDRPVEGRQWSTAEMTAEFEVEGFAAPFVSVKRRSDGRTGLLEFKHSPRVYFDSRGEFA